ncbi:glycosyltransferase family 2 protein [Chthoniobacter flavus]|uniref:glycosyltransferase family 2 protein n=1 Tax=Chthoniobacter flavus TaxID=191863 RepID=UPI00192B18F1|nr:glycosyltransferase family 2 protein [Chthoniobacter flavus]
MWRTLQRVGILRLGRLAQYPPRELKREVFPPSALAPEGLPSLAIVVPSYQQADFLDCTLESIFSQGYPRLTVAVQDGGSRDGTAAVLEKYAPQLSSCVSQPDGGQADAIVKGFVKVAGDIMAWLNADDLLMPGTLQFVGEFFATHPEVDVIYGHRVLVDELGREIGRWILPPHDAETLRRIDYVPQETLFWRKSLWEKAGGVNPRFHFALDWDLLLRFHRAGATICRLPYFLGCFRVHGAQKTQAQKSTGREEIHELQIREHGRAISADELEFWSRKTQLRGAWCAGLLRCGIRR